MIYKLLWEMKHRQALKQASEEGILCFNRRPVCGRWVCDRCFRICMEIDLCVECARSLGEDGAVVGQQWRIPEGRAAKRG